LQSLGPAEFRDGAAPQIRTLQWTARTHQARGGSELRRLLYRAAQPARSYPRFGSCYKAKLDKGMPKTAARVALARKFARIAFSLINNQQSFRPA
jgi:hypothetical protein